MDEAKTQCICVAWCEMDMENNSIIAAHARSIRHREEILSSETYGCFCCWKVFPPSSIKTWADDGQTAICPFCCVDSVIGSASKFPINADFLAKMERHWFGLLKPKGRQ